MNWQVLIKPVKYHSCSGTVQIQAYSYRTEVALVIWTPTEQHPRLRTCSKLGALKLQSFNIACWRCSSSVPLGPPIWWASCSISRAEIQNWCSYVWIARRGKCTHPASHQATSSYTRPSCTHSPWRSRRRDPARAFWRSPSTRARSPRTLTSMLSMAFSRRSPNHACHGRTKAN